MILMFHHVRPWRPRSFAPNASLEITPGFLADTVNALRREGIEIITLDDLPGRLSESGKPPFAVLTFDDGYRDNLEFAAPVLKALDAPWTLYAVDEYACGRGTLWWLDLEHAIAAADIITAPLLSGSRTFPCATPRQKHTAFDTLQRELKAGSEAQLRLVMTSLRDQFAINAAQTVQGLCADWDELRLLVRTHPNATIGAHTLTHPILSRCEPETAEEEISASKTAIEAQLNIPVRHFAFPHGDAGSAGAREFTLSRAAGYETAVTTRPGHLFTAKRTDLWSLPRVSINGLHQNRPALRALISGAAFLPQLLRGSWNQT